MVITKVEAITCVEEIKNPIMEDLSSMGVTFAEETIRRNEDGRICFVYLEQEFSGFAVHLTL